jgi:hypothetical protein
MRKCDWSISEAITCIENFRIMMKTFNIECNFGEPVCCGKSGFIKILIDVFKIFYEGVFSG